MPPLSPKIKIFGVPIGELLSSFLLRLVNDCFEGSGLIHSEVSKRFAVDDDSSFLEATHQLAVAQAFEASGSVDTLNPESAECTFFVLTIAVSILQTFLPRVLCYGPYISTATKVTTGERQNLFATVARSNVIY